MNLSAERSCKTKKPYKAQATAERAAKKLAATGETVHAYSCLYCKSWHVGHKAGSGVKPASRSKPKAEPAVPRARVRTQAPQPERIEPPPGLDQDCPRCEAPPVRVVVKERMTAVERDCCNHHTLTHYIHQAA